MNNLNNKISAGTIARTACLLLALTNQILSACGKPVLPIERPLESCTQDFTPIAFI